MSVTPAPPEPAPLEVRPGSPDLDVRRDAYVLAHPHASFFHQSGWRRVVESVHGHDPRDLYAWRGERLVGVLPLMLCRTLRGRSNLISMPYAVYGGPLGDDREVESELVAAAHRMGAALGVGHVELRDLRDHADGMPQSDLYWTFLGQLPDDPADVLKGMPKKARAEARKARTKYDLELTEGEWYAADLARLFLENKHALGSPALPAEHFQALLDQFGERVSVHIVNRDRRPVSAVMSFAFRDTLIAYYAGTQTGADRACSASNFMYMALQEWAVERGFKVFDFCRSRGDSGAFRFKRHQGFEPTRLHYRFDLIESRHLPSFTPSNPKTKLLRSAWSHLPVWAAQRLSRSLARYLP